MTRIPFILLSTTDGSPLTGASPTVTISKDGGAFASATNRPAEIGNGYYYVDLTTSETTVTNNVIVRATATGAQPTAVVWEPEATMPNIQSELTTYGAAKTSDIPDISGLATATDIANSQEVIIGAMPTTAGLATAADVTTAQEAIIAAMPDISGLSTFDASEDVVNISTSSVDAVQSGLSTFNPSTDAVTLTDAYDAAKTASQLTTSDLSGLATSSELATATDVITAAMPDVSGLSTFDPSTDKVTLNDTEDETLSAIKTKVDTLNNTDLTGIATSKNVSDAQTAIIGAMPNDYAKVGDSMTLTTATVNTIKSGLATPETVWAYTSRTLTEEISVSITTEDINNICAGVWSYVPRRLTSIVSDVIEPNKP